MCEGFWAERTRACRRKGERNNRQNTKEERIQRARKRKGGGQKKRALWEWKDKGTSGERKERVTDKQTEPATVWYSRFLEGLSLILLQQCNRLPSHLKDWGIVGIFIALSPVFSHQITCYFAWAHWAKWSCSTADLKGFLRLCMAHRHVST